MSEYELTAEDVKEALLEALKTNGGQAFVVGSVAEVTVNPAPQTEVRVGDMEPVDWPELGDQEE